MKISVQWDNDAKTVIRYDFTGSWDWHTYEQALEQGFTMTESVPHEVHMLVNLHPKVTLTDGAMLYLKRTLAALPANQGLVIIVGGDSNARTTINLFSRINKNLGRRLAVAKDLTEARSTLDVVHRSKTLQSSAVFIGA